MRAGQKNTCKNTKTCYTVIRMECGDLFFDKLRTSRRGASMVCGRERRRELGGNAPWPAAIRAGPRILPAMPFPSPGAQPTAASKRRLHARRSCRGNATPNPRTPAPLAQGNLAELNWQMEHAPRRQKGWTWRQVVASSTKSHQIAPEKKCNASVSAGRARTPCAPWRPTECPPCLQFLRSLTGY